MLSIVAASALVGVVLAQNPPPASTVVVTPVATVAPPTTITASTVYITQTPITPPAVNTRSFDQVLYTALNSSLFNLAITNPSAAANIISSEFSSGTPSWFTALPSDIQTEMVIQRPQTMMNGSATVVSTATSLYLAPLAMVTTGANGTVYINGTTIGASGRGVYPNGTVIPPPSPPYAMNGTMGGNGTAAGGNGTSSTNGTMTGSNSTGTSSGMTTMTSSSSMGAGGAGGAGASSTAGAGASSTGSGSGSASATSSSKGAAALATAAPVVLAGAFGVLGLFAL